MMKNSIPSRRAVRRGAVGLLLLGIAVMSVVGERQAQAQTREPVKVKKEADLQARRFIREWRITLEEERFRQPLLTALPITVLLTDYGHLGAEYLVPEAQAVYEKAELSSLARCWLAGEYDGLHREVLTLILLRVHGPDKLRELDPQKDTHRPLVEQCASGILTDRPDKGLLPREARRAHLQAEPIFSPRGKPVALEFVPTDYEIPSAAAVESSALPRWHVLRRMPPKGFKRLQIPLKKLF